MERGAVGPHAYHDPSWSQYTVEQRRLLEAVQSFNRDLVEAGESGRDLSTVLDRLDPDPLRYLWVDEGGGRLSELIEEARHLLQAAPPLPGHIRYRTHRAGDGAASRPTVAGAVDGRLLVAWIRWHPAEGDHIVASLLDPDGTALIPAQPISGAITDCFRPTAIFDSTGSPWVFYARSDPGTAGAVAVFARYHDGSRWRPEQRVSVTGHPSFNQEVVAHDDGSLECVWQARTGNGFGIYSRLGEAGVWGDPRRIDAGIGGDWDPAVAALPGKTSVYVWSAYVDGTYRLMSRHGDPTGLGPARPLTSGTDYALHPSLAVAGDDSVWCAFDLVTVQGHGGSGPTALQPIDRLGSPPARGMRDAGSYCPPEMRPSVDASVRVIRLDEQGVSEEPVRLAEGVEINPCGMPQLASTKGGGITVAYRILRRLPLLQYYWEVAIQQLGPDGTGPVCTLDNSDAGIEEPSVALSREGAVVTCTRDGRRDRALEWTEGFGGRRCVELAAHMGEIAWHGIHDGGEVTLAELPEIGIPQTGVPRSTVWSNVRQEARAWVAGSQERYSTEVNGIHRTLYWGDLHRHSLISRCTAADDPGLDDLYRYAWDVCDYDFWAVTDHAENSTAHQWWAIKKTADLFHAPGTFVPFYGFEWTSELGHQNVIYGEVPRNAPIFSSADEETPDRLWERLREFPDHPAITIPHHPGADMVTYDWDYYDPQFLRLVEVFQACRGNYEDAGAFRQYADATLDGTFVVDGLRRGHRFGLIASTDHGYGASYVGAYADDLSREAVFEALLARRTVAATARGIVMDVRIGSTFMGGEVEQSGPVHLEALVRGYRDLARIDVVRDGRVVHSVLPQLDLPAEWITAPIRVEWGRSRETRDWNGVLTIEGGEILQTNWWAPEVVEVGPSLVRWIALTNGFGGGGIYGPTRGGVELTVVGPPAARVTVKTVSGAVTARLADLRQGPGTAHGPDAPLDGILRLQPGTGGLSSLGSRSHRFTWSVGPVEASSWFYVRAFQVDGEMAWSSPIWVDSPGSNS